MGKHSRNRPDPADGRFSRPVVSYSSSVCPNRSPDIDLVLVDQPMAFQEGLLGGVGRIRSYTLDHQGAVDAYPKLHSSWLWDIDCALQAFERADCFSVENVKGTVDRTAICFY
ncbi:hypothetical protein DSL72_009468 [Monilinia vaccinii-corymbosi]|uniref:Uncharacterized protein n=1 Tax=Monilinia vaccinii-corymbosi TaxID=61207 RepID=A0A8A3PQF3_9HELO|nr:hypothetical protein DSL72_009468 [Monilinia vaccinii-corymbosi]